jgi:hypothetical protein
MASDHWVELHHTANRLPQEEEAPIGVALAGPAAWVGPPVVLTSAIATGQMPGLGLPGWGTQGGRWPQSTPLSLLTVSLTLRWVRWRSRLRHVHLWKGYTVRAGKDTLTTKNLADCSTKHAGLAGTASSNR